MLDTLQAGKVQHCSHRLMYYFLYMLRLNNTRHSGSHSSHTLPGKCRWELPKVQIIRLYYLLCGCMVGLITSVRQWW